MADRPRFPGGTFGNRFGDPAIDGEVLPPPIDPERFRHIQLLNEAVLVNFAASPNPRTPWGWSTLAWDVTMPTTFLPGVHVEAVLFGEGEQIVPAQGTRPARPYNETTYTLSLRTPLAVRMMGQVTLGIDFGACFELPQRSDVIRDLIREEVRRAFPSSGQVTLRGSEIGVDFGINSFVVDIPLTADVPNWFDADIDMTLGFEVFPVDGRVAARYGFARTNVSFGTASAILSGGCSSAVAKALEAACDGFFDGFIGPAIARQLRDQVQAGMNTALAEFNQGRSPPYKVHDFTLTEFNLLVRVCPVSAPPPPPDPNRPGRDGGFEPLHS